MNAVYKLINKENGKCYIGSSIEYQKRKRSHMNSLRCGNHSNKNLQDDYEKYGKDAFVFEVIKSFENISRHDLFVEEQGVIDLYDESTLYNLYTNAFGMSYTGEKNPMYGETHSEITRRKLSEINSGKNNTWYGNEAHMNKMRSKVTKRFDGRTHTEETRKKMSEAHKGREKSSEECLKLSLNNGNKAAINIDGIEYRSMSYASKMLGISRTTITSRVNNPKFENYYRCSEGVETNSKSEISTD